jgi:hypothetical protein
VLIDLYRKARQVTSELRPQPLVTVEDGARGYLEQPDQRHRQRIAATVLPFALSSESGSFDTVELRATLEKFRSS